MSKVNGASTVILMGYVLSAGASARLVKGGASVEGKGRANSEGKV